MARRSYGTGSLFARRDASGREYWYGQWWLGDRRPRRKLGPKRQPGSREGLTRSQAERKLRQLIERGSVAAAEAANERRMSLVEAGERYIDHREEVMERKTHHDPGLPHHGPATLQPLLRRQGDRAHQGGRD